MSGFAGVIRMEPTAEAGEADRIALERMARAIAFRGPDALQQTHQPGASFAFSLLTTGPAPQETSQPCTVDGETWFLGDVRLDRRTELIESLMQQGQRCGTLATDEEIALRAWQLWRVAGVRRVFFEEMFGDFSFVLWEPGRRELNCFRDVMGVRPFYYCAKQGSFSFSNTLEALRYAPGFTPDLDREYIGDFLLVSDCPRPEHTVYRSLRRLPAGHWMRLSPQGLQMKCLHELPVEEPLWLRRPEEYVEIYRDLLEKSVSDRLPNARTAIFLSGGMDSPTLAATVCTLRKKAGRDNDLSAVTADSQPLFDDTEGQWARQTAEHLGIEFELSHHGDRIPFSGFEDSRALFPEPFANPFREIYLHLYRQSATKARVVMLGYGGDDVVTGGETAAYFVYLAKKGRFAQALAEFGRYAIEHKNLPPLRAGIRARFRGRFGMAGRSPAPLWLAQSFAQQFRLADRWRELLREAPSSHLVRPRAHRGLSGTGWPHILDKEDAAYTGLPLEIRLPLFDYRLLRFVLRLPVLPWCVDKEIMRQTMKGTLPETVLQRAKSLLAQDPMELHHRKGNWRPAQLGSPAEEVLEFVNWPKLLENVLAGRAVDLWRDTAGVALNLWLKSR